MSKQSTIRFISMAALCLTVAACSSQSSSSQKTLPSNWYAKSSDSSGFEHPSPEAESMIDATFGATVQALDKSKEVEPLGVSMLTTHPKDWVPWHLDGMVAYFALTDNGVFGSVLYNGTQSIKATWQQQPTPATSLATPVAVKALKTPALKITSVTTAADIDRQLETSIHLAVATGSVHNESALRQNLNREAQRFLLLTQAMDSVPFHSGWHVDSLQLNLAITGDGQVTPVFGVSGALNIYFDWEKSDGAPALQITQGRSFVRDLTRITEVLATEIPSAIAEASGLKKSGFDLDMIQVGLGATATGNIGVTQVQGSAIGRIIFKKDPVPALATAALPAQASWVDLNEDLNLIALDSAGVASIQSVSSAKLKNGLRHAIEMSSYFTTEAKKADSKSWRLTQLEAEFDTTLSGDLKMVTIGGVGQFVLDFDRVSQ